VTSRTVSPPGRTHSPHGPALFTVGIIVLALNLRAAITGLPPLFPELQSGLHLTAAAISVLAAVPVLCFGIFSAVAAPLSRAFGEERVLGAALLVLAAGLIMRGAAPAELLFAGSVVAAAAIALLNVLLPSLVKRRRPDRAGVLIGMYLLALSAGAIAASLVAVPVFTAAGKSEDALRLILGMWAVPALFAAVLWLPQLRYRTVPRRERTARAGSAGTVPPHQPGFAGPEPPDQPGLAGTVPPDQPGSAGAGPRDQPGAAGPEPPARPAPGAAVVPPARRSTGALAMGRHALAWQVTLFMGLQSLLYYATVSWLPTLFRDRGVSAAGAGDLLALMNLGNGVTALLVPMLAHRARDQRLLVLLTVAGTGVGLVGAAFGPLASAIPFVIVLGLGQGAALGLAIFYTVARAPSPAAAASLSAFAQSTGYLIATAGPLAVGFLHAATGGWAVPVWVLVAVLAFELVTGWLGGRDRALPVAT
jgi:CP family cyanate transporter-like MFS transporter